MWISMKKVARIGNPTIRVLLLKKKMKRLELNVYTIEQWNWKKNIIDEEDYSWLDGNWRYQMQSLGEILEMRVGISGDVIVVMLNGKQHYAGKYSIEGDHLVYNRHNGMSYYIVIDRANKRLKADNNNYMQRF